MSECRRLLPYLDAFAEYMRYEGKEVVCPAESTS